MTPPSTILLIEDEPQQRETLSTVLSGEGYDVVAVSSAEEALAWLRQSKPSIILTDIKLMGLDGFSMFEKLRDDSRYSGIPLLFLTGYNDLDVIERAKSLGAAGYLTKPYELEALLAMIGKLLHP